MPLDSSSTLGGVGGGVLIESVPLERADASKGPSTPASSLLQKAAENTIGSHHNLEHRQHTSTALIIIKLKPLKKAYKAAENTIGSHHNLEHRQHTSTALIIIKLKPLKKAYKPSKKRGLTRQPVQETSWGGLDDRLPRFARRRRHLRVVNRQSVK